MIINHISEINHKQQEVDQALPPCRWPTAPSQMPSVCHIQEQEQEERKKAKKEMKKERRKKKEKEKRKRRNN
jgi:hypothetical protein